MGDKPLSLRQVAEYLGLHINTIRRLVVEDKLPAIVVGSRYRVLPADLADYLERKRNKRGGAVA